MHHPKGYMKNLSIIISFLIFVLLSGCNQKTEYLEYSNEFFSLEYPKNWIIEYYPEPEYIGMGIGFLSDDNNAEFIVSFWSGYADLDEFVELEQYEKTLSYEGEKITAKNILFKGREARIIEIDGIVSPNDLTKNKIITIYFKKDNLVYRINYAYAPEKEETYLPIINKMIDTFEVK